MESPVSSKQTHAMTAPSLKEKWGWIESDQCWWCDEGRQSREHLWNIEWTHSENQKRGKAEQHGRQRADEAALSFLKGTDVGKVKASILDIDAGQQGIYLHLPLFRGPSGDKTFQINQSRFCWVCDSTVHPCAKVE